MHRARFVAVLAVVVGVSCSTEPSLDSTLDETVTVGSLDVDIEYTGHTDAKLIRQQATILARMIGNRCRMIEGDREVVLAIAKSGYVLETRMPGVSAPADACVAQVFAGHRFPAGKKTAVLAIRRTY